MKHTIIALIALGSFIGPARAEMKLFARYNWKEGARDVSGSPLHHDGVPAHEGMFVGGKLVLDGWNGVWLGRVPELDKASEVLFRFEDVTFTGFGDPQSGPASNYAVLVGDGMEWWAAAWFTLLPEAGVKTTLVLNVGGFGRGAALNVDVADQVITHFDSIEYRFNGDAPLDERFAIRWNDGPWIVGGEGEESPQVIPATANVQINNGASADWDPMWATLGPVSMYSNQVVPEPALWPLAALLAMSLGSRRRPSKLQ